MNDETKAFSTKRSNGIRTSAPSLLLAAIVAGLAVYAWQHSIIEAAKEEANRLRVELTEALSASAQQQLLIGTLEVEAENLRARLEQANQDLSPVQPVNNQESLPTQLPYCVSYGTETELRSAFHLNRDVDAGIIDRFFTDSAVTATWENGTLYQVCYSNRDVISFVVYGEFDGFEGTNNLIGIYSGERLIAHRLFNPPSGDIGLCTIEGYIERNVIYSCGGGDGPGGWNSVFVLDHETGQSRTVKECTFLQETTACSVNLLNLSP